MSESLLIGLGSIVFLGMLAQWLAWKFHLPSILLLLVLGFLAGPVTGIVNTEHLFGNLLFPFVSLAVAIILFEGGLSLTAREFREVGTTVRNLIIIGVLVTWLISTLAAYILFDFDFKIALLFGAILVVTGPTVVLPLLRQIRPSGKVGAIAKWEGIIIDPVGAVLAVLVYEEIISGGFQQFTAQSLLGLLRTIIVGVLLGWLGARIILIMLKNYWMPDYLHNSLAIMMVITTFILSNFFQPESGLLTVTLMGILLANQNRVSIRHIVEFKENLRIILISTLFIILSARLSLKDLEFINSKSIIFIGLLIVVARPLSVFLATMRQKLNWREKIFLSWMAPRGIVAAAVASIFAIELSHAGYQQAEQLIPLTFIVIIGTVSIYGLTASPLARLLKISRSNPQGILFVGAHIWARKIAEFLQKNNYKILMVDSNPYNCDAARQNGLPAVHGNVLSDDIMNRLELDGIGRMFAMTQNDEVNALAALHFIEIFDRAEIYQLPLKGKALSREEGVSRHLRGRCLFNRKSNYDYFNRIFNSGASLKMTPAIEEEQQTQLQNQVDSGKILPLFLIDPENKLVVFTDEETSRMEIGYRLVYVELPEEDEG